MAPSTAFPAEDDPNKPCEKCGAPASWADDWTENLTFDDGLALHMSKYLASPRMWPIGYLSKGPYSPFYVEREIPQKNWRDAFEDLLALDSGGQMIDSEIRSREAVVAEELWKQKIYKKVSMINGNLMQDQKYMSLLERMRASFVRKNAIDAVHFVDETAIPAQKAISENSVAEAKMEIAMLKDNENQSRRPASMYKDRLEWIASLISSGAITGWQANLYDSSDGLYAQYGRTELTEDTKPDGLAVTELEMKRQFEEGIPSRPGSPLWSTAVLRYPEDFSSPIVLSTEDTIGDPDDGDAGMKTPLEIHPISPLTLMPMSILAQYIAAERTILRNGKMSVNVRLTNHHTNGTIVSMEIRDDPCRVLEEMNTAIESMGDMQNALVTAIRQQQYATQEGLVEGTEDDLD